MFLPRRNNINIFCVYSVTLNVYMILEVLEKSQPLLYICFLIMTKELTCMEDNYEPQTVIFVLLSRLLFDYIKIR